MAPKTIAVMCEACKGSGLYVGFGAMDGAAVQCHTCKGSGITQITYTLPLPSRPDKVGVDRVFLANPGIGITNAVTGGIPYSDWRKGKPFTPGSEMRNETCPAWWYQSADYNKKPDWKKCFDGGIAYPACPHFKDKAACWAQWDKENQ